MYEVIMPFITGLYAGILALLYVALSLRVVQARMKAKVSLGNGGNQILTRRIRVHGNFAEYVPFALLLMAILELATINVVVLHILGVTLIVSRILHAYAIESANFQLRKLGMILTFIVIGLGGVLTILRYFF